jgi:hypothetical protein
MKKSPLMIAAAAALLSATAAAGPSSPGEVRGYQACLGANEDEFRGLVVDRNYLIRDTEESRTYYINATAWEDGERVKVGFSCETTRTGRLLSNNGAAYTHYAPAAGSIQVAGK